MVVDALIYQGSLDFSRVGGDSRPLTGCDLIDRIATLYILSQFNKTTSRSAQIWSDPSAVAFRETLRENICSKYEHIVGLTHSVVTTKRSEAKAELKREVESIGLFLKGKADDLSKLGLEDCFLAV